MNTTLKYEKRMLLLVYLLCLALFTNIAVKQTPIDKMAFIIAGILIIIIGFSRENPIIIINIPAIIKAILSIGVCLTAILVNKAKHKR